MTLFPRHRLSRWMAALWLIACVATLILALTQDELYSDERSALAMLLPAYFLGLPSSHAAHVIIAKFKLALYLSTGDEPSLVAECMYLWTLMVTFGYAQWFIVLPWIARRCASAGNPASGTRSTAPEK